ncbi:hypothetical protein COCVIDRAFT_21887 [Bipolaris victoriae FI3]|uniref:Uncharacterized protein n=1 Tax=Bipolaris victoriae (strain FI3) TaxID=930091 RepID=W7ER22_BIPV3|nr:hypothetical protein COCVIDRAFT_21887 [Bipolaris victoriae FI3]
MTLTLWLAGERHMSQVTGERAVDGLRKYLVPEDPRTLSAISNRTRAYFHLGEIEKSHKLLIWVLRLQKRFFSLLHPETLHDPQTNSACSSAKATATSSKQLVGKTSTKHVVRLLGEEDAYTI